MLNSCLSLMPGCPSQFSKSQSDIFKFLVLCNQDNKTKKKLTAENMLHFFLEKLNELWFDCLPNRTINSIEHLDRNFNMINMIFREEKKKLESKLALLYYTANGFFLLAFHL